MVNGWNAYSANVITIIATSAGLNITTYIQAHINDGKGPQNLWVFPNASWKYEYSAPDLFTTVPNSANDNAPKNNIQLIKNIK